MTVFQEAGRYGGWPANHGLWAWGTEAVLGFTSAWYRPTTSGHAVDRDRKIEDWQARTLDAGDTWSLEKPSVSTNGDNYLPKAEPLNEPTSAYKRIGEYVFGSGTENSHVFVDGKEFAHQKADFAKVGDLGDADPPGDLISRHIWNESNFPDFRDADVVDIVRDYGATPDNEADDDAVAIQRAINDTTTPGSINFGKAVFIPRGHFHIKQPIFVHGGARLFGASNTISVIEISQSWQPASPTAALVTDDKADSGVLLATFAILGSDPTPFKGVSSQKYISELVLQTNNTLLRDLQFTAREYFRTDNVYQEPLVVLGGNAGGRLYNMALDTDTAHSTGAMSPNFHIIAIRGTVNQIQMYQPDTEHMDAGPQMEIASSRNVFLYAYKYELANPLCTVRDSSNVGLFGGSGNYSLYGAGETSDLLISPRAFCRAVKTE